MYCGVAFPDGVAGHARQFVDFDEPLQREPGFDGFPGAFGVPDGVLVGAFFGNDTALFGEFFPDFYPGFEPVHAVEHGAGAGDVPGGIHDGGHVQVVAQAQGIVVGVVGRGDFHGTGAEFGIHIVVGDHDHAAVGDEGVRQAGTHQVTVPLIVGVDGHGHVAKHGFHPGGGDHNMGLVVV